RSGSSNPCESHGMRFCTFDRFNATVALSSGVAAPKRIHGTGERNLGGTRISGAQTAHALVRLQPGRLDSGRRSRSRSRPARRPLRDGGESEGSPRQTLVGWSSGMVEYWSDGILQTELLQPADPEQEQ